MVKVTFTLDDETVERIRRASRDHNKPQSQVVREAVAHYTAREERLSEAEKQRMLAAIDEYRRIAPKRSQAEIRREIAEIRRARRSGGRRTRVE